MDLPFTLVGTPSWNVMSRYPGSSGASSGATVHSKASLGGSLFGFSMGPLSMDLPQMFWSTL